MFSEDVEMVDLFMVQSVTPSFVGCAWRRIKKFIEESCQLPTTQVKTPAAPAQEEICSMGSECFEPDNSLMCFKSSKCKW